MSRHHVAAESKCASTSDWGLSVTTSRSSVRARAWRRRWPSIRAALLWTPVRRASTFSRRTGTGEARMHIIRRPGIGWAAGVALAVLLASVALACAADARAASAPFRPGVVLVGFKTGVPAARQRAIARAVGA